jgi:hypothetical protein
MPHRLFCVVIVILLVTIHVGEAVLLVQLGQREVEEVVQGQQDLLAEQEQQEQQDLLAEQEQQEQQDLLAEQDQQEQQEQQEQ